MKSYKALISFIRLPNLILIAAFMWFVREFLLKPEYQILERSFALSNFQFQLLILDVLLVALIGYWLNDWADRKIDTINKPQRLLVKHPISAKRFWLSITVIMLLSVALSLYLALQTNHILELWILPVILLSVSIYAFWLKRFKPVGNVLVSLLVAALIGLVLIAENQFIPHDGFFRQQFSTQLWSYACLIFLINLAREIVKDMEDMKGDIAHSVISIPTQLGYLASSRIIVCILIISLVVELIFSWHSLNNWSTITITAVIAILILKVIVNLVKIDSKSNFQSISGQLKWIMAMGVLQLAIFSLL